MLRKIPFETSGEILNRFDLSEESAAVVTPDMAPSAVIEALDEHVYDTPTKALRIICARNLYYERNCYEERTLFVSTLDPLTFRRGVKNVDEDWIIS